MGTTWTKTTCTHIVSVFFVCADEQMLMNKWQNSCWHSAMFMNIIISLSLCETQCQQRWRPQSARTAVIWDIFLVWCKFVPQRVLPKQVWALLKRRECEYCVCVCTRRCVNQSEQRAEIHHTHLWFKGTHAIQIFYISKAFLSRKREVVWLSEHSVTERTGPESRGGKTPVSSGR